MLVFLSAFDVCVCVCVCLIFYSFGTVFSAECQWQWSNFVCVLFNSDASAACFYFSFERRLIYNCTDILFFVSQINCDFFVYSLVCFSSAMFFICCCFYTVSTIIGSDFQTSFNGIDNLCTFVCSFCLEIACACTSVNSQFYRLLPVFDSLLLFIFFFFLLCYWNAHAYQSLTRLCRSRIQLRFIGNAAAVAVVVCLVFHHLKSIHRETVLFYFFIANVCLSFHWISVDFHRIHSFAFGCVVRFVMFFFAFLFLFRTSFRWNSNFWSILSWFWRKSTHHIALCDWSIAPI